MLSSLFHIKLFFRAKPPVPSFEITQAVKRLREDDSMTPNSKKRVSFGPYVSPEYFDKALPPSTPVRKVLFLVSCFPPVKIHVY